MTVLANVFSGISAPETVEHAVSTLVRRQENRCGHKLAKMGLPRENALGQSSIVDVLQIEAVAGRGTQAGTRAQS